MTVDNMLSNMTQQELVYWMAYHKMKNEEYANEDIEGEDSDSTSSKFDKKNIKNVSEGSKGNSTKRLRSNKNSVRDLRTNKPVKHYKDLPIGKDGYRIVSEEDQNTADMNMLLFFERYSGSK